MSMLTALIAVPPALVRVTGMVTVAPGTPEALPRSRDGAACAEEMQENIRNSRPIAKNPGFRVNL